MNIARKLMVAASLAALAVTPAMAQHHGGGGGGGGGYHGGGGFHGGGGYHGGWGGGYHGGWGGYRGGWGGWYGADYFALGLLGGYALGGPWGYDYYPGDYYYNDAPPPPPPSSYYYDRSGSGEVYDGSDMQRPADNGQHCPLYWNDKTQRYEPHCG